MPRQPRKPDPAPHPDVAAGGVRRTRYYMSAFMATLKECGHEPEHVRTVLRELLGIEGEQLAASLPPAQTGPSDEQDAKRYRWLRDIAPWLSSGSLFIADSLYKDGKFIEHRPLIGAEADYFIDAAMQGGKNG